MTKTVKLTASYIRKVTLLKIPKPLYRHIVDSTTLDRTTLDVEGVWMPSYDEIKDDLANVYLFNSKLDSKGLPYTRDESSIYNPDDPIAVNVYTFEDEKTEVELPDGIFTDLQARGVVEEVI